MKVMASVAGAVLLSWAAWQGCSEGGGTRGAGGEAGGEPPGGGGGTGGGGGVADVAGCPAAAPVSGRACAPAGRLCTYGAAPRGECRDRATCVAGSWATRAGDCAPAAPEGACPAAVPVGVPCATNAKVCAYPGGVECMCVSSIGWQCDTPRSPGPGCPATPPNAGTPCAGSISCTYACGLLTANAVFAQCGADGVWTWSFMPCAQTNRTGSRLRRDAGTHWAR